MSTINKILVDIFSSLSFQGSYPMTAPRHPVPQPEAYAQSPVRRPVQKPRPAAAARAQAHRPAFG